MMDRFLLDTTMLVHREHLPKMIRVFASLRVLSDCDSFINSRFYIMKYKLRISLFGDNLGKLFIIFRLKHDAVSGHLKRIGKECPQYLTHQCLMIQQSKCLIFIGISLCIKQYITSNCTGVSPQKSHRYSVSGMASVKPHKYPHSVSSCSSRGHRNSITFLMQDTLKVHEVIDIILVKRGPVNV